MSHDKQVPLDLPTAIELVRMRVPRLVAFYLFGSVARGDALEDSDVDLAFLARDPFDNLARWELAEDIAALLHRHVDLVDLRAASTVMRVQVLRDSKVLLELDRNSRALFEAVSLGAYARFNFERRFILADVKARGQIHG